MDVLQLPRKKFSPPKRSRKSTGSILNRIQSLSFPVDDPKAIRDLNSILRKAVEDFGKHTTSEAVIDLEIDPLRTSTKVSTAKAIPSQSLETLNQKNDVEESSLRSLSCSTKSKHIYSGRVDEVAATMRKMFKVSTSVNYLFKKENDGVTNTSKRQSRYDEVEVEQMDVDSTFDSVHQAGRHR